jgi:hypothetical protein
LIPVKSPKRVMRLNISATGQPVGWRISDVSDSAKRTPDLTMRPAGRDAISAVKFSERLTAEVDAWAEDQGMVRSDAIRQLVELGLRAKSAGDHVANARRDPVEIEHLAVKQIDQLLDPSLPTAERERRIRRLTEGPPEFSDRRVDLPKSRK